MPATARHLLDVTATAGLVLLVAPLQKEPRLFVALLAQVMQKVRIGLRRELARSTDDLVRTKELQAALERVRGAIGSLA